MNVDIMERWCARLEDEKSVQIKGKLTAIDEEGNVVGNCCLGVLTEMAREVGIISVFEDNHDVGTRIYTNGDYCEGAELPVEVSEWAGITSGNPSLPPSSDYPSYPRGSSLAELNDSDSGDWGFKDIAKIIREKHETF